MNIFQRYFFGILLLYGCNLFAQKNLKEHISRFSMVSLTYKLHKPVFIYLEVQGRSIEDYSKLDYYEIKGGLGYIFPKGHQPFIGIGRYANYQNGLLSQEEFRKWLQYIFSHKISSVKLDHRWRAEQRYFHDVKRDQDSQDQRYRYRLNISRGINSSKIVEGTVFAMAFEEVFFGKNEP